MARRRAASARRNAPSGGAARSTPIHTTAFGWRSAVVVVLLAFLAKFCIDGRRRYRAARDAARQRHEEQHLKFLEVFMNVPLTEVQKRDPKGLYKKVGCACL